MTLIIGHGYCPDGIDLYTLPPISHLAATVSFNNTPEIFPPAHANLLATLSIVSLVILTTYQLGTKLHRYTISPYAADG